MRCATVLGVIVRARIPIGRDGRNRPSLFPFGTATGRNAQAKSLFNAHACMRSFMKFPPDKIGLYLDWRTQEVGIAAARSGDEQSGGGLSGGDIYHALAMMCGLTNDTDVKRWKDTDAGKMQRQRMKALQLGINYGMGVRSLARGLGRHPLIGSEVIIRHQQRYPTFWAWRAEMVERAMLERVIVSEFDGWPLHLSTRRTSARSTIFRCRAAAPRCCGWRPIDCATPVWCRACWCMTASCSNWTTRNRSQHAMEIMRAAGRRGLRRSGDRRRR